jgi:hypothetical protein
MERKRMWSKATLNCVPEQIASKPAKDDKDSGQSKHYRYWFLQAIEVFLDNTSNRCNFKFYLIQFLAEQRLEFMYW